jgi:multicomponent Na+:H+ antiporter subunit D
VLAAFLCLSTLLNIAYLLPIPFRAFFRPAPGGKPLPYKEAPLSCLVAIVITASGCFLLFFLPDAAIDMLIGALALQGAQP